MAKGRNEEGEGGRKNKAEAEKMKMREGGERSWTKLKRERTGSREGGFWQEEEGKERRQGEGEKKAAREKACCLKGWFHMCQINS